MKIIFILLLALGLLLFSWFGQIVVSDLQPTAGPAPTCQNCSKP